jgi:nitrite reductase (NADH) small subunit
MTAIDNIHPLPADLDGSGTAEWWPICPIERLTPDRGVAALVEGCAVAVFLLSAGTLYAIDNVDPISGASVLSRGLVGDIDGSPTVASPMYKQRFDLASGRCHDLPDIAISVHEVSADDGVVYVRLGTRG